MENAQSPPPDWFVKALAEEPELGTTTVGGVAINHRSWGPAGAPDVVLVHGGVAHAQWWDHVAPLLIEGRRRVVALDLSGHGSSGRRTAYSIDRWAREVVDVAGGGRPVVVGHSMGGLVALRAALHWGDRLAGTIAIDCRPVDFTPEEEAANASRARTPLRVYPTREAALARFRPVPEQWALPYVRDQVAETSVRRCAGGWTWKFDPRIFSGQDFDNTTFARLSGRVLVVRAEHGISAVDTGLPSVEIPDAGHHVMLDRPLALVSVLRTVLGLWER
ncbi:alpha/beta fold hydrolase [Amycolatopsis jejuensis]|uniref:alpha/beta fold hydrolase n=1 Tax=Amycolatopsis jejuensis TaxID=330084 RepID=UPI000525628F|nr:alpha/beta fold hydrolase [Amycolatopsis jejuensis]